MKNSAIHLVKAPRNQTALAQDVVLRVHGVALFIEEDAPGSPYVNVYVLDAHADKAQEIAQTLGRVTDFRNITDHEPYLRRLFLKEDALGLIEAGNAAIDRSDFTTANRAANLATTLTGFMGEPIYAS